jgi:aspartyl-tRNA(Asn)/glutamyl-tRNA(Gln) amidotransferase subunit A
VADARFENTIVFDATGQPAISVPCGFTSAGMPIGLMLIARRWDEVTLLRAARSYEHVRGAFPMPPI